MERKHYQNILVFCGSSFGNDPGIIYETVRLGMLLGERDYNIVYGGGVSGLMGVVGYAAQKNGARVKGIIPKIFHKAGASEQGNLAGSEEQVVEDMFERKKQMILQSQACVALPGGFGTLDEIYEMAVTQQIMTFDAPKEAIQPSVVINYKGYYDGQIDTLNNAVDKGLLKPAYREFISFVEDAEAAVNLLDRMNMKGPVPAKAYAPEPKGLSS